MSGAKKLVLILTISLLVTETSKEDVILKQVSYIYYLIWFKKNEIQALIDSSSKVNAMTLTYAAKLDFKVRHINIRALKVNSSTFDTFKIVLAKFQVEDKLGGAWFFQKTFLVANTTSEVIFRILFLTFSKMDI